MSKDNAIYVELAAIRMAFAAKVPESARRNADIERALITASASISTDAGARIPGPLFSWIAVHGERVNIERLRKLMMQYEGEQTDLIWLGALAYFGLSCGQTRWKLLARTPENAVSLVATEFAQRMIAMRGTETWAEGTGLLIPKGSVTISTKNVLSPEQLAGVCDQYRNRRIFGTCWRADIATAMERGATTPAEAAQLSGCSYESAHRVMQELRLASYLE